MASQVTAHINPEDIRFDNIMTPDYTVLDLPASVFHAYRSCLIRAFNRRRIVLHAVHSVANHRHEYARLFLCHRSGSQITSVEVQYELQQVLSALLQFAPWLARVTDPDMTQQRFEQFVERQAYDLAQTEHYPWLRNPAALSTLATVLDSTPFLWEHFLRWDPALHLPVLTQQEMITRHLSTYDLTERWQHALPTHLTVDEARHSLTTFKAHELFRICVRHLVHPGHTVSAFAAELAALADVLLAGALDLAQRTLADKFDVPRLANGRPCAFAICGLGKLGGGELGYASDLDLLCVYGAPDGGDEVLPSTVHEYATALGQRLLYLLSARHADMFAPDFRLRPHGQKGTLATSHTAFRAYYRHGGHAAPFERQALIKLRWIAGDAGLGRAIETWRDSFVYSTTPCDLAAIARMRQQQRRELVYHGTTNLKYSRGALVDVEYIVQSLQLRHGATMPALRTVNTLQALAVLRHTGLLPEVEAQHLQEAYGFFRGMIDALRMVRGQAKDVVVPDERSDAFSRLARPVKNWEGQGMPEPISYQLALHMQRVVSLAHKYGIDAASSLATQASA